MELDGAIFDFFAEELLVFCHAPLIARAAKCMVGMGQLLFVNGLC
jgi:hypothetical protein